MEKISNGGWVKPTLEARIAACIRGWERAKQAGRPHVPETYPFITLSRDYGCDASPLAHRLADLLNERCRSPLPWMVYDKELLDKVSQELHLRRHVVDILDGRRRDAMTEFFDDILNKNVDEVLIFRKLAEVIRSVAFHGHAIIVGRGSQLITHDLKTGLHVRLTAPRDWRVRNVAARHDLPLRDAEKDVKKGERERAHFYKTFFVTDTARPFHFDLVMDNSKFDVDQMARIVEATLVTRFDHGLIFE